MKGTFDIDQNKKIYRINLEGFADVDATLEGVDRLEESLRTFPVQEWSIVVDCRNLSTFKPEILPILERCYKDIYEKFARCIMINPENSIAKSQLNRVARNSDFKGIFVNTEEEMIHILEG